MTFAQDSKTAFLYTESTWPSSLISSFASELVIVELCQLAAVTDDARRQADLGPPPWMEVSPDMLVLGVRGLHLALTQAPDRVQCRCEAWQEFEEGVVA